jgi:prevent-host-death family protein
VADTTVGIRDLKARLSAYVELAHSGQTVVVTDRGRPVAELRPVGAPSTLDSLIEAGLATRPSHRRPLPRRVRAAASVSDLVAEQRR